MIECYFCMGSDFPGEQQQQQQYEGAVAVIKLSAKQHRITLYTLHHRQLMPLFCKIISCLVARQLLQPAVSLRELKAGHKCHPGDSLPSLVTYSLAVIVG